MKPEFKVVVDTAGAAMLTSAEMKAFARVDPVSTVEDDIFTRLEKAARAYIEDRSRTVLTATTFLYYASAPDPDGRVYLPRFPVTSITWFKVRTGSGGAQTTLVADTDYRAAILGTVPHLAPITAGWGFGTVPDRWDFVEVKFVAGYTSTTRPAYFEQAALALVNFWYENRGDANRPVPQYINDLIDLGASGM